MITSGDMKTGNAYQLQEVELGSNQMLCNGETVELKAPSAIAGNTWLWQDGSKTENYMVNTAGTYWVKLENECGVYSDTVSIEYEECNCRPFVPSAFTPNGDGLNDKVGPLLDCDISAYRFVIVNRFGEMVFRSNIPTDKWDGRYKGIDCDMGSFFTSLK